MHFGHFGSVDRFEPAKCIFWYRFPTEAKPWTDSNRHTLSEAFRKSSPFKIYLQSHRCKGILDRFELPHRFKSNAKRKYKIAPSFQWTDPNYRKPNTDLLKTKKKPSAYIAKCLSAKRLAFFIAERMITDECNYLKGRQNCSRSTPRRTKTVGWRSLVFGGRITPPITTSNIMMKTKTDSRYRWNASVS